MTKENEAAVAGLEGGQKEGFWEACVTRPKEDGTSPKQSSPAGKREYQLQFATLKDIRETPRVTVSSPPSTDCA